MPTGFKSAQAGNAVPLTGEAEMRVESSALDALTITGHSSMSSAASFLVLRSNIGEGTTGAATELFNIGSSGELRQFQMHVVEDTTGSSAPTLGASQSGQVHVYGNFNAGARVLLPAPVPGLTYTIIQGAGNATHALAVSSTRGTGAQVIAPFRGSGLSTALVVGAPTTVAGMGAVFVAISTITWQLFPFINGIEGASGPKELTGAWTSVAA